MSVDDLLAELTGSASNDDGATSGIADLLDEAKQLGSLEQRRAEFRAKNPGYGNPLWDKGEAPSPASDRNMWDRLVSVGQAVGPAVQAASDFIWKQPETPEERAADMKQAGSDILGGAKRVGQYAYNVASIAPGIPQDVRDEYIAMPDFLETTPEEERGAKAVDFAATVVPHAKTAQMAAGMGAMAGMGTAAGTQAGVNVLQGEDIGANTITAAAIEGGFRGAGFVAKAMKDGAIGLYEMMLRPTGAKAQQWARRVAPRLLSERIGGSPQQALEKIGDKELIKTARQQLRDAVDPSEKRRIAEEISRLEDAYGDSYMSLWTSALNDAEAALMKNPGNAAGVDEVIRGIKAMRERLVSNRKVIPQPPPPSRPFYERTAPTTSPPKYKVEYLDDVAEAQAKKLLRLEQSLRELQATGKLTRERITTLKRRSDKLAEQYYARSSEKEGNDLINSEFRSDIADVYRRFLNRETSVAQANEELSFWMTSRRLYRRALDKDTGQQFSAFGLVQRLASHPKFWSKVAHSTDNISRFLATASEPEVNAWAKGLMIEMGPSMNEGGY